MATKNFDNLFNHILTEAYGDLISPNSSKLFNDDEDEVSTISPVDDSPETQEQLRRKSFNNGYKRDSAGNFILRTKDMHIEFDEEVKGPKDIKFQLIKNPHEQFSFKIMMGTNEPLETTILSVNNDKEAMSLFDNIADSEDTFIDHFISDLDLRTSIQFLPFIELLEKKDKENQEKKKKEEAEKGKWKDEMTLPEDELGKEEPKAHKTLATIAKEKEEEAKMKKAQLK